MNPTKFPQGKTSCREMLEHIDVTRHKFAKPNQFLHPKYHGWLGDQAHKSSLNTLLNYIGSTILLRGH